MIPKLAENKANFIFFTLSKGRAEQAALNSSDECCEVTLCHVTKSLKRVFPV